jgi:hypothetical protein
MIEVLLLIKVTNGEIDPYYLLDIIPYNDRMIVNYLPVMTSNCRSIDRIMNSKVIMIMIGLIDQLS